MEKLNDLSTLLWEAYEGFEERKLQVGVALNAVNEAERLLSEAKDAYNKSSEHLRHANMHRMKLTRQLSEFLSKTEEIAEALEPGINVLDVNSRVWVVVYAEGVGVTDIQPLKVKEI